MRNGSPLAHPGVLAAVGIAFLLRAIWPLADPAERLSWSRGVYTDPAAVVHAARNVVQHGEWIRDESRDLLFFPLHNGITALAYRLLGVSRWTTQILSALFGAATVLATAWAVGRCRGRGAAVLAAVLGTSCAFLTLFARVPFTENLIAPLLMLSAGLALGRSGGTAVAAGFAAGAAIFLGKLHAIAFLPALLLFAGLREGRARAIGRPLIGLAAAAAVWVATVLVPFREDFVDQIAIGFRQFEERSLGIVIRERAAGLLESVRTAWVFHRIPVVGAVGSFFVFRTLAIRSVRRRALDDGSALFALWFASAWIYFTLLPYRAPRYYVPVVPALIAGTAIQLRALAGASRGGLRLPRSRRERGALLAWVAAALFVGLDSLRHWLSIAAEELGRPGSALDLETAGRLRGAIETWATPGRAAVFALALTGLAGTLWLRSRREERPNRIEGLLRRVSPAAAASVLTVLSVLVDAAQYVGWATRRTYSLEEAKASLDTVLGPDAVVLGSFAPALLQDGTRTALPRFGGSDAEDLRRHEVTHVVLSPGEEEAFRQAFPGILEHLPMIAEWTLRSREVAGFGLYAFPLTARPGVSFSYEPTLYERAVEAWDAGDLEEAIRRAGEFAATVGRDVPDGPLLTARCHFLRGDLAAARADLLKALRRRPNSPLILFNLGNVHLREGDVESARRHWRRGLELDPGNERMAQAYRELAAP
jgi:4-amino-4-deoxy-L-arabinose transferase-like glycosyltransferase